MTREVTGEDEEFERYYYDVNDKGHLIEECAFIKGRVKIGSYACEQCKHCKDSWSSSRRKLRWLRIVGAKDELKLYPDGLRDEDRKWIVCKYQYAINI